MTKDDALKLALEFIERVNKDGWILADFEPQMYATIAAIKQALAQPERDNTYVYASSLATAIWQKHYIKESPKFALLDTTEGVLTQIDNMTCGLVREKLAQPEQEPADYWKEHAQGMQRDYDLLLADYEKLSQRTWVDLTNDEVNNFAAGCHLGNSVQDAIYKAVAKLKEKNNA